MNQDKLNEIIANHKKWLSNEQGGIRANLSGADLSYADLRGADLRGADLSYADLSRADLSRADLSYADLSNADLSNADLSRADLSRADLRGADLRGANLRGADLRGANLDFACLPLWCGSLSAHFDDRQIKQIIFHAVKAGLNSKNTSDKVKAELTKMIDLANEFHRVKECGMIENRKTEKEVKHEKSNCIYSGVCHGGVDSGVRCKS